MNDKKIEDLKVGFLTGIQSMAREYADKQKSIPILEHHIVAAICDKMASSFVFNVKLSAEINNIKADLEAIRRATICEYPVVVDDVEDVKNGSGI